MERFSPLVDLGAMSRISVDVSRIEGGVLRGPLERMIRLHLFYSGSETGVLAHIEKYFTDFETITFGSVQ